MSNSPTLTQSDVQSLRAAAAAAWSKAPAGAGQVAFDWNGIRYRARFSGSDMVLLQPSGDALVTIHGTSRSSLAALESQEEPQQRVALRAAVDRAIAELENHQPRGREFAEAAKSRLKALIGQQQLHASRLRLLEIAKPLSAVTGVAVALFGLWLGGPGSNVLAGGLALASGAGLILASVLGVPMAAQCIAWRGRQQHGDLEEEAISIIYPRLITPKQRDSLTSLVAEEPFLRIYLQRWIADAGSITAEDLALVEKSIVPMRALKRYDMAQRQTRAVMERLREPCQKS